MWFEQFDVGQRIITPGRTITESDIVTFAGLSGDYNQIHTDAEFSSKTPFGKRVAHGLLVLSIASGLAMRTGVLEGTVIAFREINNWKFSLPVFIGDTIFVELNIIETKPIPRLGGGSIIIELSVKNQHNEVTMKGTWTALVPVTWIKMSDPLVPGGSKDIANRFRRLSDSDEDKHRTQTGDEFVSEEAEIEEGQFDNIAVTTKNIQGKIPDNSGLSRLSDELIQPDENTQNQAVEEPIPDELVYNNQVAHNDLTRKLLISYYLRLMSMACLYLVGLRIIKIFLCRSVQIAISIPKARLVDREKIEIKG
jgi:acyl dehydratase